MTAIAPAPAVEIAAESALWDAQPGCGSVARDAVAAAIATAGVTFSREAELSVLLADDARMQELNRDWRGKDAPTNVLSFPGADDDDAVGEAVLLGDIVLAYETVAREAEEEGKAFLDHFAHLVVHGTLHLFGYDHLSPEEAEEMEDTERAALGRLGIADPYSETSPA